MGALYAIYIDNCVLWGEMVGYGAHPRNERGRKVFKIEIPCGDMKICVKAG